MHWRVWGMKGKKDNLPLNYNLKSILTRDVWTGQGRDDKDELHSIKANTGSSTERRMCMFVWIFQTDSNMWLAKT